ncbi:MAG TPA: adenylate/guanylate cyclase domain-containing protein [Thermoanaerobaculia bacterium]|nr:adenylate/guanylate cyclase domain-containing protein [Thermoanaerobaculia bacterium]
MRQPAPPPEGLALTLKLVATIGNQTVTLPPGRQLLVGRSIACDLPVRDPSVSRQHAELELGPEGLQVSDLGSTNGTFVNGERVTRATARPGEQVAFGRSVFELREEGDETVQAPLEPENVGLDATILRRVPVAGPADIAARVSAPSGRSLLRIGGQSLEERQARRLALFLDIAKELSGQFDLDRLLDKVVDLTFQVMSVDRVAILLLDAAGELKPRVSLCRSGGRGTIWQVPEPLARESIAERTALLIENAPTDTRFGSSATAERESVQSAMCAPLLGGQGTALGLIYLDNLTAPRSFSDEDLDFLSSFSGMIAVAIENSRLVERVRREAVVLSNFQRYFAPELAAEIAAQEGEIRLGGTKRQAVVLFADIRGFTTLSEALSPDEIASLLNEYFTEMVEIVFEYGGTLDKFMGDAMMAIWGAPLHRPDDPDRAARAAVAMQRELRLRNEEWGRQGRRPLTVGIGLQAGEVFAGNIGSDRRLEYTVIGDAVNTAAHLCSEAGPGEILLGETLYQTLVAPPAVTALPPLQLKGKAQAVAVYRVEW